MISTKDLDVFYNENKVLKDIQLEVKPGKITGIIGPNGAGKSTLIKAILNIVPHSGKILINGKVSKKELKNIAYVEQKSDIDHTFPIKVKECVSLGTYTGLKLFQKLGNKEWSRVSNALQKVNLSEYENRQIGELSGGQFQRVLLARCLVQEADYIFLDEPFVGLDPKATFELKNIMKEMTQKGCTIFFSTHVLDVAEKLCNKIAIIHKGKLVTCGNTDTVKGTKSLEEFFMEVDA